MKTLNTLIASLLLLGSVSATNEDNLLDLERTANARTINEFIVNEDKGEKIIEENEISITTTVRFLYENKGYVITFVDVKEENDENKQNTDSLTIKIYSINQNVGKYLRIVDESISGKVEKGFSMYYFAKEGETVLPEKESDRLLIKSERIIQFRGYNRECEEQNEESYFQAEYDRLMLEIMDFYEN